MQQLCQIQGHEGNKLSHICIFIDCLHNSRWLCKECIRNTTHDHIEGVQSFTYLRTEIEFLNDFKANIQPQIESMINTEEGILIKCKYIQNIKNDLINDAIFKQELNNNLYEFSNIMLINSIQDLIEFNNLEISKIQNLKKAYKQLIHLGLRSLNLQEIKIFLNSQNSNFQGENLLYEKVLQNQMQAVSFSNIIFYEFRDHVLGLLQKIYIKLLKLRDYIKYNYQFLQCCCGVTGDYYVHFLHNEKYLTQLIYANILQVTDMNKAYFIKKIILQYMPIQVSFDNQWRHIIIKDVENNLYHYQFSSNVRFIKQIRKYKFMNYISNIAMVNNNKFMIFGGKFVEIRDLTRNRLLNKIIFQKNDSQNASINWVSYGRIKSIIVAALDYDQNIYIYKDDQCQPFIQQNVNAEKEIKILQTALTSDDSQLFTQDQYELKLWQIDYQEHKLVLTNRILIDQHDQFWFSDKSSFIIRENYYSIQIFDKKLQISEEIEQEREYRCHNIQFNQQCIVLTYGYDQYQIETLRKARTNYDKLQFY